jgi:hypothetical protein
VVSQLGIAMRCQGRTLQDPDAPLGARGSSGPLYMRPLTSRVRVPRSSTATARSGERVRTPPASRGRRASALPKARCATPRQDTSRSGRGAGRSPASRRALHAAVDAEGAGATIVDGDSTVRRSGSNAPASPRGQAQGSPYTPHVRTAPGSLPRFSAPPTRASAATARTRAPVAPTATRRGRRRRIATRHRQAAADATSAGDRSRGWARHVRSDAREPTHLLTRRSRRSGPPARSATPYLAVRGQDVARHRDRSRSGPPRASRYAKVPLTQRRRASQTRSRGQNRDSHNNLYATPRQDTSPSAPPADGPRLIEPLP